MKKKNAGQADTSLVSAPSLGEERYVFLQNLFAAFRSGGTLGLGDRIKRLFIALTLSTARLSAVSA